MFGKKDKITGCWSNNTAIHLKLLADNFVLSMKNQLNNDSIVWKDFEKSIISLIKESADFVYNEKSNKFSIKDEFLSPFTSFTTVTTKLNPEKKSENLDYLENTLNSLEDTLSSLKSPSNTKINPEDLGYLNQTLDSLQESLDMLKNIKTSKKE